MSDSAPNSTGPSISNPDKPTASLKRGQFMGITRFDISDNDFANCIKGRKKWSRWKNTIENEENQKTLSAEFAKGKPIIVRNEITRSMVYLR